MYRYNDIMDVFSQDVLVPMLFGLGLMLLGPTILKLLKAYPKLRNWLGAGCIGLGAAIVTFEKLFPDTQSDTASSTLSLWELVATGIVARIPFRRAVSSSQSGDCGLRRAPSP